MNSLFKGIMLRVSILVAALFVVLLVFRGEANAAEYMSVMVGVFHSADKSPVETKFMNIGYRTPLMGTFSQQVEGGLWADIAGGGRRSSGYAAYQVGIDASASLDARFMIGPAVITTPDAYLGGVFPQFSEDFFLGVHGKNGNNVGLKYKHISSGGLVSPNTGRDFAGLEAGINF